LLDEDYIPRNPMARIPAPEVEETLPRILTDAELKALFGASSGISFRDRRDLALLRIMRLRDRHRLAETEWLWLPSRGPMPANTIQGIVKRGASLAGIGNVSCHTLRHTAAHRAMEAGLGGTDMQTLFGWKGPAMLLVYGRSLRASRAQGAARRLAPGDRL
jgi:site-specific recombinase XerD